MFNCLVRIAPKDRAGIILLPTLAQKSCYTREGLCYPGWKKTSLIKFHSFPNRAAY